jgi:cellulose synthase/poly-beta-1,6-N-acetylglucosamine synthase-like glycosyltransferase
MTLYLGIGLLALSTASITAYPVLLEILWLFRRAAGGAAGPPIAVDAAMPPISTMEGPRPRGPLHSSTTPPRYRLITVFYNEGAMMREKAAELSSLGPTLLVSDGSDDNGPAEARHGSDGRALLLELPRLGKTGALRAALEREPGHPDEILVLSDANVRFHAATLNSLLATFADPSVGAAAAAILPERGGPECWYWRLENHLRRREAALGSAVGCSGALWAVRRGLLESVDYAEMLCEDLWIPLVLRSRGHRIAMADGPPAIESGVGAAEVPHPDEFNGAQAPSPVLWGDIVHSRGRLCHIFIGQNGGWGSSVGADLIETRRRRRLMAGNLQILARLDEIHPGLSWLDRLLLFGHKRLRWLAPLPLLTGILVLATEAIRRDLGLEALVVFAALAFLRPIRYFLLMNLALASALFSPPPSGAWAPERH